MKAAVVGVSVLFSLILIVNTVNAAPYFTVYPTEGSVNTDIFLQIRGLPGTGFYEVYYLYIFWDDILLGTFPDNSQTYDHYFDTHFSPPNSNGYSSLGNHTVYFEVWNGGRNTMFINATFDFTIIEYVPCPEYLALNATYYELLGNYTDLLTDYDSLLASYTALTADHNELSANYADLFTNYDSLAEHYGSLNSSYDELTLNYGNLQASFSSLKTSYDALKSNYDTLESNSSTMTTNYGSLVEELNAARNLSYLFIAATMVLAATTIFFAARKPKMRAS